MMNLILLVSGLLAASVDGEVTSWTTPALTSPEGTYEHTPVLAENTAVETDILTVEAVDAANINAEITYSITKQTPATPAGVFEIAEGTDTITLKQELDYETTKTYTLEVEAVDAADDGDPSATATITLNVGNVGPVFAVSSKTVCAQQGSAGGTKITTVEASREEGETDALTFDQILDGMTASNLFEIEETTGDVKVIADQSLDGAETYILTVEASVGTEKDTMALTVNVGDCSSASMVSPINLLVLLMALIVSINKYAN